MDLTKNAEPAPNSTDLGNLRSDLLSKRKEIYSEGIRRYSKHEFDCRIQIHDEKSSDNDKMLKRYFDCPGAVKNQRKYDDSALPYYKAWLLNQLDLTITRKGDSLREAYRFYWNFLEVKSIESVREYAAQKIQERIDELFIDLSCGRFIRYYYTQIQYGSAVDIFLDGLLRNVYDHLFAKVHDAFLTMTCVRKCWGALRAPLESLTRLQMDASFNSAGQEQIWQLVKRQALCLELMLENANLQLRQDQDYMQLDLCNISAAACRKNCLQKNQAIIQRLDIRPLKIESTELLFLSEEYRALLYNCYIVLQHEKEKSISEIVDSFSKSYIQ